MIASTLPFIIDIFIQTQVFTTTSNIDEMSKFKRRVTIRVIAFLISAAALEIVPENLTWVLWGVIVVCSLIHLTVLIERRQLRIRSEA